MKYFESALSKLFLEFINLVSGVSPDFITFMFQFLFNLPILPKAQIYEITTFKYVHSISTIYTLLLYSKSRILYLEHAFKSKNYLFIACHRMTVCRERLHF